MALLTTPAGMRFVYFAALAFLLTDAGATTAQSGPLEIQVKAAFLPKFAAYVNWPPNAFGAPDEPVILCIIGRDPFGRNLDEAAARQHVDLHPILIRRLESTAVAEPCNIAFLGGSTRQSAAAMLESLRAKPILTVTDDNLGSGRGMVHFTLKDGRVRFYIDDALAARSNLSISARLLSLAISVNQGRERHDQDASPDATRSRHSRSADSAAVAAGRSVDRLSE